MHKLNARSVAELVKKLQQVQGTPQNAIQVQVHPRQYELSQESSEGVIDPPLAGLYFAEKFYLSASFR
ncbi:hypothetical protein M3I54_31225 [Paraburkholderia sp. CNPSo 3274]|uniref:hypothetical protein n=1 Tax=Paraburkholderia sp. CNPSo 3274 TaxID=2940932 RepID=UPI0020B83D30|nr:hypothetical protein [Paraburkholderia sp. CNPSo 3274]MCP3711388.1 hypothetical protein [Paraburkholderia sp. CNPSo 3274]